jgi:4-aminobutyrate aminotransferase/(S)-3-amino-2-methylpropionate transaminase
MTMLTEELYDEYLITGMVAGFEPIELSTARGTRVTASDGREYLDFYSGISVVNAGHGHPAVLAAARAQMDAFVHGASYVYYNPRAAELGKRMADITPGRLKKTFFCNSGAEAVEGALRLARQFTGRKEIVALTHGFHGRTAATLSITGNRERKRRSGPYLSGVAFAPAPYAYRCPFGSRTELECAERCAEALVDVLRPFDSRRPHRFRNPGKTVVEAISVNTPPSF